MSGLKTAGVSRPWSTRREAYVTYLRSPLWQAKKTAVFRRAGYTCEMCRTSPAVEVHHKHYRNFGHENLSDLVAVCRCCHRKVHDVLPY